MLTLFDSEMKVSWNLDTLGDFVIMRSNGQPVYNFCVTVDDAAYHGYITCYKVLRPTSLKLREICYLPVYKRSKFTISNF